MADHGWTITEACEQFAAAGVPVNPHRFRMAVRAARLQPVGRKPSPGPQGGRGEALYAIGELQRLHGALLPWLAIRDAHRETLQTAVRCA